MTSEQIRGIELLVSTFDAVDLLKELQDIPKEKLWEIIEKANITLKERFPEVIKKMEADNGT